VLWKVHKSQFDQSLKTIENKSIQKETIFQIILIRGVCFKEDIASRVAFRVLQALSMLHEQNIEVRSLSPDNIHLDFSVSFCFIFSFISKQNDYKIHNYGMFYLTKWGNDVWFPIGFALFALFADFFLSFFLSF